MRIGLVNRVVSADKLEEWVREFTEKIARTIRPNSL
jgi:enoyl-CoA hydratase/carnithine racemase